MSTDISDGMRTKLSRFNESNFNQNPEINLNLISNYSMELKSPVPEKKNSITPHFTYIPNKEQAF